MGILSTIRLMIGLIGSDPKVSNEQIPERSPKKSSDVPAPSYEEAVSNNTDVHNTARAIPKEIFNELDCLSAFSQHREVRTSGELGPALESTGQAEHIGRIRELSFNGSESRTLAALDSKLVKQLKLCCPSLRVLALRGLDLCPRRKDRYVQLRDLPANIERLSLRDSAFEPSSFFAGLDDSSMRNLQVLDAGRAILVERGSHTPEAAWPRIDSLRELYLEGALRTPSASSIESVLKISPKLEVLDLEGAQLNEDVLVMVAKLLPNLRELYLGHTGIRDASVMQLVQAGRGFKNLETICLCETNVSDTGIGALVEICPSLKTVTAKRSVVRPEAAQRLEASHPGLSIRRVEITHIYAVFTDRACDHFSSKHTVRAAAVA